ncbi:hypothetical protein CHH69_03060, partial [Terribacillus saccharophilus]
DIVTDENGQITIEDLKPGNYQFIETKAPAGYDLNNTPIVVTVEKDQQEAAIVTAVNSLTPGTAVLEKVDADDSSKLLEGAVFNLLDEKGNMVKEKLITDENGWITVEGLKPGNYQFVETKAPAGYQLGDKQVAFTVEKAQVDPVIVTVENTAETTPENPEEPNTPEQPANGETPNDSDKDPAPGNTTVPAAGDGTGTKPTVNNQHGLPASLPQTGEQLLSLILMAGIISFGVGGLFIWNAFRTQTERKRQ